MARDEKGLRDRILEGGVRLAARAAEKVMSDPRGQEALARAVGLAQRGRKRAEELQARLLRAAGIPGRQDYEELSKQLARLKRKARELSQRIEAEEGPEREAGEAPAGESPGGNGREHH
jgi:hypothetical protein